MLGDEPTFKKNEPSSRNNRRTSPHHSTVHARNSVRALVMQGKDAGTIRKAALADGMKTLRDDGIRKVFEGASSFEEIMRITQEDALE